MGVSFRKLEWRGKCESTYISFEATSHYKAPIVRGVFGFDSAFRRFWERLVLDAYKGITFPHI